LAVRFPCLISTVTVQPSDAWRIDERSCRLAPQSAARLCQSPTYPIQGWTSEAIAWSRAWSEISGTTHPCGGVVVEVAEEDPAGFVAAGGARRLVADRCGGLGCQDDLCDPVEDDGHGSSQVGQPGTGGVPGRHRIFFRTGEVE
jgi:hypothetical protein